MRSVLARLASRLDVPSCLQHRDAANNFPCEVDQAMLLRHGVSAEIIALSPTLSGDIGTVFAPPFAKKLSEIRLT